MKLTLRRKKLKKKNLVVNGQVVFSLSMETYDERHQTRRISTKQLEFKYHQKKVEAVIQTYGRVAYDKSSQTTKISQIQV